MTVGERIKARRKEIGKSVDQIADELGKNRATIYRYESSDIKKLPLDILVPLARVLHTTPWYLMGWTEEPTDTGADSDKGIVPPGFEPLPEMDIVPMVGRIACGTPITAEQNIERMVSVPSDWRATFTLKCKGKSMEPRILDGDLVAIRKQPTVENGEVAAVRIGEEATLKHVYVYSNYIELRPENPEFESIIKIGDEMEDVVIEGKAVGLCRGI